MNVHAKSRLTLEPLRTLRPETKGQAGACPDQTRAIPCKVRAETGQGIELPVVFGVTEVLPDDFRASWSGRCHAAAGSASWQVVSASYWVPASSLETDDGPGHRVGGQEAEIEQGVDVGPQQQPVGDVLESGPR